MTAPTPSTPSALERVIERAKAEGIGWYAFGDADGQVVIGFILDPLRVYGDQNHYVGRGDNVQEAAAMAALNADESIAAQRDLQEYERGRSGG